MEKNPYLKLVTPLMIVIIFGFSIAFLISEKKDFSENENRTLAKAPKLSWESIMDKSFMSDLSTYMSDHFPMRDGFINIKTQFEKATLHTQINGIYIADDNFYIEEYKEPQNTEKYIDSFNRFVSKIEKATPVMMLVPNAVTVYSDKLPPYAKNADQIAVINQFYEGVNINTIDVASTLLEHKNENNLYYKLDHHWTTHGAYYAYVEFCKYKGIEPTAEDKFDIETVTDKFKGTVYSKVNDDFAKLDEINLYYGKNWDLEVEYSTQDGPSNSVYNLKYLDEKDKYSVFLNNLNSQVTITNNNAQTDEEIVVIKDSYANSLVPFLINHYKTIYVFDTRYYRMPVSSFINEHEKVTDVLILYNMNTMDTDLGVKGIF